MFSRYYNKNQWNIFETIDNGFLCMNSIKKIDVGDNIFEIDADEKDLIIIQRQFARHTVLDLEIQNLPVPKNPLWLKTVVITIRKYQKRISPKLGNRCVFDPSCSRYAEMAFRKNGFFKGIYLTCKRLYKCRARNGGTDLTY